MVRSTGLAGPAGAVTDPDRAVGTVDRDRVGDAAREVGRRVGESARENVDRGRAEDPVGDVVRRVRGALEEVFAAVAGTAADTAELLTGVSGSGRGPVAADLAALRPGLGAPDAAPPPHKGGGGLGPHRESE
ncbi:hypothetical protein ACFWWN_09395, partial [Streptomyces sp. NPDC059082]